MYFFSKEFFLTFLYLFRGVVGLSVAVKVDLLPISIPSYQDPSAYFSASKLYTLINWGDHCGVGVYQGMHGG